MTTQLLLNFALFLSAAAGCLIFGAIKLNDPPLHLPPGMAERLKTYLSQNVAETRRNHPFSELELRVLRMAPAELFNRAERAMEMLDWEIVLNDPEQQRLKAVVSSRLWKFKDDVELQLVAGAGGTELHIRSSSRVGKGDLAANTRHILNLQEMLARQI